MELILRDVFSVLLGFFQYFVSFKLKVPTVDLVSHYNEIVLSYLSIYILLQH